MADIRFGGTRMFYYTGYRIDINKFNNENQQAKKNSTGKEGARTVQYNEINRRLKAINASLELYFQNITESNKEDVKALLDKVCNKSKKRTPEDDNGFFSMFTTYIENEVSESSRNDVKTAFNYWKKYEAKRKIILSFESIKVETLRDFESYLKSESTKPVSKNTKKLIKAPKSTNTIHRIMKTTRAF